MSAATVAILRPVVGNATSFLNKGGLLGVSPLPQGFPEHLDSKLAWTGKDVNIEDHIYHLTDDDIEEIMAAYKAFKAGVDEGSAISQQNFPLPTLGPKLREMSHEVHHGRGFCIIRGLDKVPEPKNTTEHERLQIYLGVQAYIASKHGRQDYQDGNLLVHIKADNTTKLSAVHHRSSTEKITFHTEEACDVVGWYTKQSASSGGECIISSAYQVYNELAASKPELVRVLAKGDWSFSLYCRPIIFYQDGKLITNFGRAPLLGSAAHERPKDLPTPTKIQVEALDQIQDIAEKNQLEFKTQAGDMHFINNCAILHRRDAFVNSEDNKRELSRTWNRDAEHGWPIPEALAADFHRTFNDEEKTTLDLTGQTSPDPHKRERPN